jgi:hypothetical protein
VEAFLYAHIVAELELMTVSHAMIVRRIGNVDVNVHVWMVPVNHVKFVIEK